MANEFDQFDKQGANPFDRFDAQPPKDESLNAFQRGVIGAGAGAKSAWDAAAAGLARGVSYLTEPNAALKKVGYRSPISEGALAQAQQIEQQSAADRATAAPVLNTTAGKVGDFIGQAGITAPTMLLPGVNASVGARAVPELARAAMARAELSRAALIGAGTGAAITPGDAENRGIGVAFGTAGGLVGQGIGNALGRAIAPTGTADTNALRTAGVRLTPGQALGPTATSWEQKAQSLPIVGDMITNARRGGIEQFNVAATNEALAPLGITIPKDVKAGRGLINYAYDKLDDAYGAVVPKLTVKIDDGLKAGFQDAAQVAQQAGKTQQFADIVRAQVTNKLQDGELTGEALKKAESELKRQARGYRGSQSQDERTLGDALMAFRDSMMETAGRYSPPGAVKELAKADAAYAGMERVGGAAGMLGAKEGVFTPAQLLNQVRSQSGGVRKMEYRKGNALMQDFATSAENVLGSKVPDSGTVGRALLNFGVGGALTGGAYHYAEDHPLLAGALALGAGAYTPPGRMALNALMRPGGANSLAISNQTRALSPYFSAAAMGGLPIAQQNALQSAFGAEAPK